MPVLDAVRRDGAARSRTAIHSEMLTPPPCRRYLHQRVCKHATSGMSEQGRYFGILTWVGAGRQPTASTTQGVMYVKGFREFISRGNLIELAVAVVIGTAFTAVVTAIVADLITPLIAAIGGQPNFANLTFTVHKSTFKYGALFNALLSFLIIAAVGYYLIVAPMAK